MIALLVKPAAMRKPRYFQEIRRLQEQGAQLVAAHTPQGIREEVASLGATSLVACGGDGTVHLAVNALAGTDAALAVLPMGTGNDFARYLHIGSVEQGLKALHIGQSAVIDLGQIHLADGSQRWFAGIASCGFDAQVNERANNYRGPRGTAKYLMALGRELHALGAHQVSMDVGHGSVPRLVTLLAAGNTSSYGGGMRMCPHADATDGLLDVSVVDRVSRRLLVKVLPRVFSGSHIRHPAVTVHRTPHVTLSAPTLLVYADGERVGIAPTRIEIHPAALKVHIPPAT